MKDMNESTISTRVAHRPKIEALDLRPRPGGLAQKLEARDDTVIEVDELSFR